MKIETVRVHNVIFVISTKKSVYIYLQEQHMILLYMKNQIQMRREGRNRIGRGEGLVSKM